MMGVNMGYQPGPELPGIKRKFAWLPTGTDSGKCLWLKPYWDVTMRDPGTFFEKTITMNEKEFFIWTMTNPIYTEPVKRKKAIFYYSQF